MKALLLSAYDAESHRLWRGNVVAMFPGIEWSELTLPARYFSWRVRGNSLSWAFNHRATLTDNHDFLLATSMTDLSALRGFVPELGRLPTILYFHENQFAYPANPTPATTAANRVEPQMLSIYGALCADELVFNSAYNRDSFLAGVEQLLARLPDHVPQGLIERLRRSRIIPVPLSDDVFDNQRPPVLEPEILNIVWNHRHEYDKGPALLLNIIERLSASGQRIRLHLLGQRFRQSPAEFSRLQALLDEYYLRLKLSPGYSGYVHGRDDYRRIVASADVVLSTALHDFQGLSLLEACALGCTPLAPRRLAYPEYLSDEFLYAAQGPDNEVAEHAAARLIAWGRLKKSGTRLPGVCVQRFRQASLTPAYQAVFDSALNSSGSRLA